MPLAAARFHQIARASGGVDLVRAPVYLGMLARFTALAPLRWTQRRREHRHPNPPLRDAPVFILGHWRSGTTHVQELLGADPRHTTPTLFTSLFSDVATSGLQAPMDAVARTLRLQHAIQRQPLQLGLPAEGDIGLCLGLLSKHAYTWGHLFPRSYDHWMRRHIFELDRETARCWLADYDTLMCRVSALAHGARVVMKSPGDTARIPWLLERYPDARFVYVHRDPLSVYHSTQYLWGVIRRDFSLQTLEDDRVHARIVDTYTKLLRAYLRDRECIPPGQLIEVRYETLRRSGEETVTQIYDALGLGDVPDAVRSALRAHADHVPAAYETSPALAHELRSAWAFSLDMWPQEDS